MERCLSCSHVGDDDPGVPSKNLQSNTVLPGETVRAAEDVSPYDPFEQACALSSKMERRLSCSHVGDDDDAVDDAQRRRASPSLPLKGKPLDACFALQGNVRRDRITI